MEQRYETHNCKGSPNDFLSMLIPEAWKAPLLKAPKPEGTPCVAEGMLSVFYREPFRRNSPVFGQSSIVFSLLALTVAWGELLYSPVGGGVGLFLWQKP